MHGESFLLLLHWNWVELFFVVYYDIGDAKLALCFVVLLRWLILHLVGAHLRFLVYFLAMHLVLPGGSGRVVAHLRVVQGSVIRMTPVHLLIVLSVLLLLLVHNHHARQVASPFPLWVVIANIVNVLLPDGLHVADLLLLRLHRAVTVVALRLLLLLLAHGGVRVYSRARLSKIGRVMLNLRGCEEHARRDLVSLVRVLRVVHLVALGELRVHEAAVRGLVHRYLTDVRLGDHAGALILVQPCVAAHCLYAICGHRSVPWRGQHLVRHVKVRRGRPKLLGVRVPRLSGRLTKIVLAIWSFVYEAVDFRRLLVLPILRYVRSVLRDSRKLIGHFDGFIV